MNQDILETIKRSAAVPSMPQVVTRFLEIMQDPNFEYRDLVRVLSADPGTVSEILRLSNSALFGVRNKVVSLQHALTLLGPKRVRSLLLGRYLVDAIAKKKLHGLDMSYFWRRCLAASVVASHFSANVIPRHRDEASIGALLAAIGIPILTEAFPAEYEPIVQRFAPHGQPFTPEEEQAAVGVSHAQVSAMVLAHWSLPPEVTEAVRLYDTPEPGEDQEGVIARMIQSGHRVAKMLCEVNDAQVAAQVCIDAAAFAGVDTPTLVDLLPTIESDIEELADALRIDVIPSDVYALVAKGLQEHLAAAEA
ncbi:MAG: HDOD domain-containing protein [Planctomycetota bacterium]|nr:MAG: HDOD domain-containing protein [Planctomycetota bacterium]